MMALMAPQLAAGPFVVVVGGTVFRNDGGEMRVIPNGALAPVINEYVAGVTAGINANGTVTTPPNSFETFCLELREGLQLGAHYDAILNNKAINGGVGPAGDPISKGTAYLYFNFAKGTLANYDYTLSPAAGRKASAIALQEAIWYLEDEITLTPAQVAANVFLSNNITTKFGTIANAKLDNNGLYAVGVLNLYGPLPKLDRAQDVLILTVPEPGTMMLMGLGLASLAIGLRRRFAK